MNVVIAYTDGSSLGNPGPGGYGIVLTSAAHKLRKEIAEGYRLTTNNRMELLAATVALETLKYKNTQISIYSDSAYVINAVEKGWLSNWLRTGFRGRKNEDLWRRFWCIYQRHKVKMVWVKGHAGIKENERCDELARAAATRPDLKVDEGYGQLINP